MTRVATIKADDGDGHRVELKVKFTSRNGLSRHEHEMAVRSLSRVCADAIRQAKFSDFGPENTVVKF